MNSKVLKLIVFPALAILYRFLSPFVAEVLPLSKEIVRVRNFDQKYDQNTQYPVLDFIGLVEQHAGYTAEEYDLTTRDGYNLKLHRITGSPSSPKAPGKPVVYLQHGIDLSSDSWVLIGPGKDLAFLLAEEGNDVWMGNVRGNTYSRSHVSKDPQNADFWSFSYHDMAVEDVPLFIDFALNKTEAENLTYYGYSMGTSISFAMLSELTEYNEKIKMVHSAAPVVFWRHELKKLVKLVDEYFDFLQQFVEYFHINEVLPLTAVGAYLGEQFCGDKDTYTQPLCVKIFSNIGLDPERFNKTALPNILAHFPAGTSMANVFHYYQNYKTDSFRALDYGDLENERRYGSVTPPEYNLTKVTAPVTIWYATADDIVNEKDVLVLSKELPNVVSVNKVNHDNFNHFDFLWAKDVKELLYDRLNI